MGVEFLIGSSTPFLLRTGFGVGQLIGDRVSVKVFDAIIRCVASNCSAYV